MYSNYSYETEEELNMEDFGEDFQIHKFLDHITHSTSLKGMSPFDPSVGMIILLFRE